MFAKNLTHKKSDKYSQFKKERKKGQIVQTRFAAPIQRVYNKHLFEWIKTFQR